MWIKYCFRRLSIFFGVISFLLVANEARAQTVDFAAEVTSSFVADLSIRITSSFVADETWRVVGACSNRPNVRIRITSSFVADKSVRITNSFVADRSICITNANSLDEETLRQLGLIN